MLKKERYSRQSLIEGWNQEQISHSSVAVIGVGALGSIVATNLTMIGVKRIFLIDPDIIEISNLTRQLLFSEENIGEAKVKIARENLLKINPDVEIIPMQNKIENIPIHEFKDINCLVEGLDTFESRRYVNSLALALKKPLVSGGIYAFNGNVQVIIPYESACLECQPLIPIERLQKSCTRPGEPPQKTTSASTNIENENSLTQIIPTVAPVSTVIGGIMAQECVKIFLGLEPLKEYLFWDAKTQTFTKIPLHRRENCFACSDKFKIKGIPLTFRLEETIEEFRDRVKILFNLKNPEIAIENQLLGANHDKSTFKDVLKSNHHSVPLLFILDDSLPKPLKIKLMRVD